MACPERHLSVSGLTNNFEGQKEPQTQLCELPPVLISTHVEISQKLKQVCNGR